jgi:hypothetical protein
MIINVKKRDEKYEVRILFVNKERRIFKNLNLNVSGNGKMFVYEEDFPSIQKFERFLLKNIIDEIEELKLNVDIKFKIRF